MVEEGRIVSLPWSEAVPRSAAPRSNQAHRRSGGETAPLLRRRGRLSGLSASAFFHHRLLCCRKYSIVTSVPLQ